MEKIHCLVDGLGSSTNKTQVKNALENLEVCVDVARGSIEVMFNEHTSEGEIKNCIENTGFSIRS